jgi:hypothetical protein
MIKHPEKFRLPTSSRDRVELLVNWNEDVATAQYVKMRINDEYDIIIPRTAFIRAAMFIGDAEEQEELIPTRQIPIRRVKKKVTVELLKDFKAGETITIEPSFDVPLVNVEEFTAINNK